MTPIGALEACATGEPSGTFEGQKSKFTKGPRSSPPFWQASGRAIGASSVAIRRCVDGLLAARFQSPEMVARWRTLGSPTCALGGPMGTHSLNYVAIDWTDHTDTLRPGPPRSGYVLSPSSRREMQSTRETNARTSAIFFGHTVGPTLGEAKGRTRPGSPITRLRRPRVHASVAIP